MARYTEEELKEKVHNGFIVEYPDEMTVILQHQFWDLTVNEANFEVGLSFGGIPERLTVPFEAINGFFCSFASWRRSEPAISPTASYRTGSASLAAIRRAGSSLFASSNGTQNEGQASLPSSSTTR